MSNRIAPFRHMVPNYLLSPKYSYHLWLFQESTVTTSLRSCPFPVLEHDRFIARIHCYATSGLHGKTRGRRLKVGLLIRSWWNRQQAASEVYREEYTEENKHTCDTMTWVREAAEVSMSDYRTQNDKYEWSVGTPCRSWQVWEFEDIRPSQRTLFPMKPMTLIDILLHFPLLSTCFPAMFHFLKRIHSCFTITLTSSACFLKFLKKILLRLSRPFTAYSTLAFTIASTRLYSVISSFVSLLGRVSSVGLVFLLYSSAVFISFLIW